MRQHLIGLYRAFGAARPTSTTLEGIEFNMNDPSSNEPKADHDPEEFERWDDEMNGDRIQCPICGERLNLGAMEYCDHLLCHGGEGSYTFADDDWDFSVLTGRLQDAADEAIDSDLDSLPAHIRELAEDTSSNGAQHWRHDSSLRVESWETDGVLGGYWEAYFHPGPEAFAARIRGELKARLEQLSNRPK